MLGLDERDMGYKMKKPYFIIALAILIIVPGVAYFYAKPLSPTPVHARDLGIHPRGQDLSSARYKIKDLQSGQEVRLDSREMTAWLTKAGKNGPLIKTQVKINRDQSMEISGLLVSKRLEPYASSHGFSAESARQLVDQLGGSEYIPIYIRCKATVNNGELKLKISNIELGDLVVPQFIIRDKQAEIERMVQKVLQDNQIKTLRVENQELYLEMSK